MTFWEWIRATEGMEYGRREGQILEAIKILPQMGTTLPTDNPQSFEEVKDFLMRHGFSRQEVKDARGLWTKYRQINPPIGGKSNDRITAALVLLWFFVFALVAYVIVRVLESRKNTP